MGIIIGILVAFLFNHQSECGRDFLKIILGEETVILCTTDIIEIDKTNNRLIISGTANNKIGKLNMLDSVIFEEINASCGLEVYMLDKTDNWVKVTLTDIRSAYLAPGPLIMTNRNKIVRENQNQFILNIRGELWFSIAASHGIKLKIN